MGEVWWSEVTLRPTSSMLLSGNPYEVHKVVEAMTDGAGRRNGEGRTLWRLDRNVLLVQAGVVAQLEKARTEVLSHRERRVDDAWTRIETAMELAFSCFVNPTKAVRGGELGERGRRAPIHPGDQVRMGEWWTSQGERGGFEPLATTVVSSRKMSVTKRGRKFSVVGAELSGRLLVSDAERFRETLRYGVGRERGFGCGLLLVWRG